MPVFAGVATGIALPTICYLIELRIELKNRKTASANGRSIWWTLRPQKKVRNFVTGTVEATPEEVDFDPRHGHYMKCGEIIVTLASASIVFLPSLHFSSTLPWLGLPMVLLGFTVVYALAFMAFLTYFYEMQLQDPDSFTLYRSCTIFSLGFGGLGCFAVAYFVLSVIIANALSGGFLVSAGH
jgi:hypothetical protein